MFYFHFHSVTARETQQTAIKKDPTPGTRYWILCTVTLYYEIADEPATPSVRVIDAHDAMEDGGAT